MIAGNLSADIGWQSLNKHGEQLCGDRVEVVKQGRETVVVLADGLGSGVKANILSTLTSKILSTMMAHGMNVEESVAALIATLPVTREHNVAYSTFTIIRIDEALVAEVIEYDNPAVMFFRRGKATELKKQAVEIDGKTIYRSKVYLEEDDTFVAISDGAEHAGTGNTYNFNWQRSDIIAYLEKLYRKQYTAKVLTTMLLEQCEALYGWEPADDTTVCTVKLGKRRRVNLLIGPPANPCDKDKMLKQFFGSEGQHIICGGTTSEIAAEYLGKKLEVDMTDYNPGTEVPPMGSIEGVDLVTEGIITVNKVLLYAQDYIHKNARYMEWMKGKDGASRVARILFMQATDIDFVVGCAVNPAHQNPDLKISFSIKMRLMEELTHTLRKMGKHIKISYF